MNLSASKSSTHHAGNAANAVNLGTGWWGHCESQCKQVEDGGDTVNLSASRSCFGSSTHHTANTVNAVNLGRGWWGCCEFYCKQVIYPPCCKCCKRCEFG